MIVADGRVSGSGMGAFSPQVAQKHAHIWPPDAWTRVTGDRSCRNNGGLRRLRAARHVADEVTRLASLLKLCAAVSAFAAQWAEACSGGCPLWALPKLCSSITHAGFEARRFPAEPAMCVSHSLGQ